MATPAHPQAAFACAQCFADRRLQDWIRARGTWGPCGWCGSKRALAVALDQLHPLFTHVAGIYESQNDPEDYENADFIWTLLQDDWQIFSDRVSSIEDLSAAILGPGYQELLIRRGYLELSMSDIFYAGLDPVDLGDIPPPEDGEALPGSVELALGELGTTYSCRRPLYRARIYEAGRTTPYSPQELGAPPAASTPPGRANRAGEPKLYVATDLVTAIAEKRAGPGQHLGVASIKLARPQRILNLVRLPYIKSPFFEEYLRWKGEALELLGDLGEELSKPVTPDDAPDQYRVSQEACDVIQGAGFDGVAYPSGLGPGHNVVFFTSDAGRVTRPRIVRIDGPDATPIAVEQIA